MSAKISPESEQDNREIFNSIFLLTNDLIEIFAKGQKQKNNISIDINSTVVDSPDNMDIITFLFFNLLKSSTPQESKLSKLDRLKKIKQWLQNVQIPNMKLPSIKLPQFRSLGTDNEKPEEPIDIGEEKSVDNNVKESVGNRQGRDIGNLPPKPEIDISQDTTPLAEEVKFDSGNDKKCPIIESKDGKLLPYAIINNECAYTNIISK